MNLKNKNRLTKDIVLYENFLTREESLKVVNVINKQMEKNKLNWMPISFYESYSSVLPQDGDPEIDEEGLPSDIFSKIREGIISAVASVHDLDNSKIEQIGYHTQKWEPGAFARLHSDNTDEKGNTGPFARSRYAAFLYLNDDFKGGLLNFPNQNIAISPRIGMLAAFDGGFNNMHEVTLITSGLRYTIGSFWDDRKESDYPQEVRDSWEIDMKEIRDKQEVERAEWQNLLKDGVKIDQDGKKYKIGEK